MGESKIGSIVVMMMVAIMMLTMVTMMMITQMTCLEWTVRKATWNAEHYFVIDKHMGTNFRGVTVYPVSSAFSIFIRIICNNVIN